MTSRQTVVIEVNSEGKVHRILRWSRNKNGSLEYKVVKPLYQSDSPEVMRKFYQDMGSSSIFFDMKTGTFVERLRRY